MKLATYRIPGLYFSSNRVRCTSRSYACASSIECSQDVTKLLADRDLRAALLMTEATILPLSHGIRPQRHLSLRSSDQGKSFQGRLLHKWGINACPMSSMDFADNANMAVGAWETGGQVYWARRSLIWRSQRLTFWPESTPCKRPAALG